MRHRGTSLIASSAVLYVRTRINALDRCVFLRAFEHRRCAVGVAYAVVAKLIVVALLIASTAMFRIAHDIRFTAILNLVVAIGEVFFARSYRTDAVCTCRIFDARIIALNIAISAVFRVLLKIDTNRLLG